MRISDWSSDVCSSDLAIVAVHLRGAFDPSKLVYDQSYQNEQAVSGVFKNHLGTVTQIIRRHFVDVSLIEVGCGKGYFLDHLQAQGYRITGIDPAYEGDNPNVVKAPFERSEEHTSELQSLMRISYAVFCLKK